MAQTECKTCDKGRYAVSSTVSTCSNCDAGTYQDKNVAELYKCITCDNGLYAAIAARSECEKCDKGKYLMDPDGTAEGHDEASDCKDCPVLKYGPFKGKEDCYECDTNTDEVGLKRCSGCIPGESKLQIIRARFVLQVGLLKIPIKHLVLNVHRDIILRSKRKFLV